MSTLQQAHGNTARSRPLKPKLTIDTRAPPKPGIDQNSTQSAPVGTRQERGIPPMHQAVDRHCAKVAEMMNSPTWRSRRPGLSSVDDDSPYKPLNSHDAYDPSPSPRPLTYSLENDRNSHSLEEHKIGNGSSADLVTRRNQGRRHADSGIYLSQDGEAMSILGIHPFSEIPESPSNTFIISAAVSRGSAPPENIIFGNLQSVLTHRTRSSIRLNTAEDELSFELDPDDQFLGHHESSFQSPPQILSHLSTHPQCGESLNEEDLFQGEVNHDKQRDIHRLMEQDEAIKIVNSQHASPRLRGRSDPEDKQRFRDLLGRLQYEIEALDDGRTNQPTLNDPAIVSFAPKTSDQHYSSKNLVAQSDAAERTSLQTKKNHAPSDSGYASPTAHSRPSTRAQSRSRHGTSDDVGPEPITIQHEKFDSKDSSLDRSSKSSALNPAAKEFSSTNAHSVPSRKRVGLAPPPVPDHAFLTPPQTQAHFGASIQAPGVGFTTLPNLSSPLTNLGFTQPGLLQLSPAMLPQASPFSHAALPPPPGFGLTANIPSTIPSPGIMSGLPVLSPPSVTGLPGLANSPGLVPASGPICSDFAGAFHQQLPSFPSCNNPAHQSVPTFSATQGFQAPTMPQLAPPAPPSSVFSPGHGVSVTPPMAPVAPVVNPLFRKNVPKPKVPNTTGQQYWEYWHELRRTFEPGYAQKSKQNQQKRYMKQQVHKSGGSADQS